MNNLKTFNSLLNNEDVTKYIVKVEGKSDVYFKRMYITFTNECVVSVVQPRYPSYGSIETFEALPMNPNGSEDGLFEDAIKRLSYNDVVDLLLKVARYKGEKRCLEALESSKLSVKV